MGNIVCLKGLLFGLGLIISPLSFQKLHTNIVFGDLSTADNLQDTASNVSTELSLNALSAVLMDADSGRILYEKEGDVFRPMASTTKIMTCILALENGNLADVCTVSKNAASQPKVHLGASSGTKFYLKDLLYSLMLESHNDTAVTIAEQVGGSVELFTAMMNQKARDIGCTDTYFLTPNGLDASVTTSDGTQYTHGTTARDLAKIMRYCINDSPVKDEFLSITQTQNYSFTDTEKKKSFSCVNHNALLTMMDGALSGKTGFTGGAGYSYVGAIESEGRTYIIALLGSGWPPHKSYKWEDARKLFDYGKKNFFYRNVFEEVAIKPVPVLNGIPNDLEDRKTPVEVELTMNLTDEEKELALLMKEEEQVEKKVQLPGTLVAPVKAGDVVGQIIYQLDGTTVKTYPVYAKESIRRIDLSYCIRQICNFFFVPEKMFRL